MIWKNPDKAYNKAKALREDYGVEMPTDYQKESYLLQCQAEAARFNVFAVALCMKPISKTWVEKTRADDIKREIASLRAVVGAQKETKWVPDTLLKRLLSFVTKSK